MYKNKIHYFIIEFFRNYIMATYKMTLVIHVQQIKTSIVKNFYVIKAEDVCSCQV